MPKVLKGDKYKKKYKEEDVIQALKAVENGMSQRKAAQIFKVPRQTLQFRKSDKFRKTSLGPSTILTSEEEATLEEWILSSYKKGFPLRKLDIQMSVKEFLDSNPRDNPFQDNLPGEGWYRRFLKRHPNLTHRTPEAVTSASSVVSEADIRKWFSSIEEYLKSKNLHHILEDPTRVFNGDETCFYLCPKNFKVIAPRGARNVYEVDSGQAKMNITVMFTFSAAGQVTSPMLIYPYKRIPAPIIDSVPSSWGIGHSDNGWMKAELFYEYIGNVLYPHLKKNGTVFPIILFVDGHCTHQTLKLSQLCTRLEIILIALYPNATRIMQPADVAAFKPLKTGWKKAVLEFRRRNPNVALTKEKFAPLLKCVIEDYAKADTIKNGFRASGLHPWNASSIDYSKCLGTKNINTNKPIEVTELTTTSSITYDQFKNIVGEERIEIFERIEQYDEDSSDEFIILYKLYREFKKKRLEEICGESEKLNDILVDMIETDNIEIVFQDIVESDFNEETIENMNTNTTKEINNEPMAFDTIEQNMTKKTDLGIQLPDKDNRRDEYIEEDISLERQLQIYNQTTEHIIEDIISSQKPTNSVSVLREHTKTNQINTSLRDFVVWPKTPERKGKKQSEKLPFVLTSSGWKKIQMEKIETKKQEQEKKEARKSERESKKTKQLSKKNINKRKKIQSRDPGIIKDNTFKKKGIDCKTMSKIDTEAGPSSKPEISEQHEIISANSESKENKTGRTQLLENPGIIIDDTFRASKVNYKTYSKIDTKAGRSSKLGMSQHHIRRIFTDSESEDENLQSEDFPNNPTVVGTLCFSCTHNISTIKNGIRCGKCNRTYHNKCIVKFNPTVDKQKVFYCKSCSS